jgi:hypothetical protein
VPCFLFSVLCNKMSGLDLNCSCSELDACLAALPPAAEEVASGEPTWIRNGKIVLIFVMFALTQIGIPFFISIFHELPSSSLISSFTCLLFHSFHHQSLDTSHYGCCLSLFPAAVLIVVQVRICRGPSPDWTVR